MGLHVVRFDDAAAFRDRALPFLMRDEARSNLIIGITTQLVENAVVYSDKLMATVERDGSIVAAFLTTPPFEAVVSDVNDAHVAPVADAIVDTLIDALGSVRGVQANVPVAESVARTWERRTSGEARRRFHEGVYAADHVTRSPSASAGLVRRATESDRELVLRWHADFDRELHLEAPLDLVTRLLDGRLRGDHGGIDLWEVEAEPVCMVVFATVTPNGARIGPVYTPPEHRGRGYGRALMAATTQALLDSGCRFCFLYTDLANPTSNRLYQEVGYRQLCEAEIWRFTESRGDG